MSRRLLGLALGVLFVAGCAGGPLPVPSANAPTPITGNTPTPTTGNVPTAQPTVPTNAGFAPIPGASLLIRSARDAAPKATNQEVAALARANGEFALDLYRALAAGNDDNVVLGPHSISSALAMVYAGARGETAAEMAEVLHLDAPPDEIGRAFNALDLTLRSRSDGDKVDLRLANQAFALPGYRFLDSYLTTLSRDFGAPMAELDFRDPNAAREVINNWAAERTNGRITDLFPPGALTPETVLVLVNAVSLDAQWRYVFDPAHTKDEPFHLPGGGVVDVPMMHFDLYLPLVSTEGYAAVELPYGAGDLSMVVILPQELAEFEATMDVEQLDRIFAGISEQGVHLSLPKFSFKSHAGLDNALQQLGMTTAYGDADFSGMTGSRELFLQTVQHEAFIEVDEEGTEAHAATGGAMVASHGPTISFDRPFFFVIRDRQTGAIVFLGRVTDPRD